MTHERYRRSEPEAVTREQVFTAATALLAALLIAASKIGQPSGASVFAGYLYWVVRIAIEGALFVLIRDAIERHYAGFQSAWRTTALAMFVSLVPFVLAVTALDIVLGYPELGSEDAASAASTKLTEFGLELIFLLDNHVFLCILLTIPRLALATGQQQTTGQHVEAKSPGAISPARASVFTELDPPLKGELLWAEAQEHYVRLTTSEETRMVLIRFSDILRNLPHDTGFQVHRSHWVSVNAIKEAFRQGTSLRLQLQTDDIVPVSRTYRAATEQRLREAKLIA